MNRLFDPATTDLSEPALAVAGRIHGKLGRVPNAYQAISALSPAAMEVLLQIDTALKGGSLSGKEVEAIRLAVSEVAGCDYCLAAHTQVAKGLRLGDAAIEGVRHGTGSGDARLDALTRFVRYLVTHRGTVPEPVVQAALDAGYSASQLTEAMLAVAGIGFTNLFNRSNDTELDFPAAP